LLTFGILKFDHEAVEEVGVSNKETKIVVSPAGFLAQLGAGGGGNVVGLSKRHLLLLLRRRRDVVRSGGLGRERLKAVLQTEV
jgi:hypothetical protein